MQNTSTSTPSKDALRWYFILRVLVYLLFIVFVAWVFMKTIFPDGGGEYDFASYGANKNTLSDPVRGDGSPIDDGMLRAGEAMQFSAQADGDFGRIETAILANTQEGESLGSVSVVRAYQAYLYPEGNPIVCPREGSLVTAGGAYAISSGDTLRFFVSEADIRARGYATEQFLPVSEDVFSNCVRGANVFGSEQLAQSMIVLNASAFYQLQGDEWIPFASERAFLSQYREEEALSLSQEVFDRYPIGDARIGFLSGMLVSHGESVYVVESGSLRPVADPETFLSKGYAWEDVVAMTPEEFGAHIIGDYYSKKRPHPSGTVFREEGTERLFVVESGMKREVMSFELRDQFASVRAIPASVTDIGECAMARGFRAHRCAIYFTEDRGIGAEYQFRFVANADMELLETTAKFIREKSRRNLSIFASEIMAKLTTRYPFLGQ